MTRAASISPMKHGAKLIAESTLVAVDYSNPERDYDLHFTIPAFTCLCPHSTGLWCR